MYTFSLPRYYLNDIYCLTCVYFFFWLWVIKVDMHHMQCVSEDYWDKLLIQSTSWFSSHYGPLFHQPLRKILPEPTRFLSSSSKLNRKVEPQGMMIRTAKEKPGMWLHLQMMSNRVAGSVLVSMLKRRLRGVWFSSFCEAFWHWMCCVWDLLGCWVKKYQPEYSNNNNNWIFLQKLIRSNNNSKCIGQWVNTILLSHLDDTRRIGNLN